MRITYDYALVGDAEDAVRTVTARRPSIYAAEKQFKIGLLGAFGKGEVSVEVLDYILWDAHSRSVRKGETDGVALVWSEFAEGELPGALEWAEAVELGTGNPRSSAT